LSHERLYSVDEVAAKLKVTPETVRRWCRDGRLSAQKPLGTRMWRVHTDTLLAVLRPPSESGLRV